MQPPTLMVWAIFLFFIAAATSITSNLSYQHHGHRLSQHPAPPPIASSSNPVPSPAIVLNSDTITIGSDKALLDGTIEKTVVSELAASPSAAAASSATLSPSPAQLAAFFSPDTSSRTNADLDAHTKTNINVGSFDSPDLNAAFSPTPDPLSTFASLQVPYQWSYTDPSEPVCTFPGVECGESVVLRPMSCWHMTQVPPVIVNPGLCGVPQRPPEPYSCRQLCFNGGTCDGDMCQCPNARQANTGTSNDGSSSSQPHVSAPGYPFGPRCALTRGQFSVPMLHGPVLSHTGKPTHDGLPPVLAAIEPGEDFLLRVGWSGGPPIEIAVALLAPAAASAALALSPGQTLDETSFPPGTIIPTTAIPGLVGGSAGSPGAESVIEVTVRVPLTTTHVGQTFVRVVSVSNPEKFEISGPFQLVRLAWVLGPPNPPLCVESECGTASLQHDRLCGVLGTTSNSLRDESLQLPKFNTAADPSGGNPATPTPLTPADCEARPYLPPRPGPAFTWCPVRPEVLSFPCSSNSVSTRGYCQSDNTCRCEGTYGYRCRDFILYDKIFVTPPPTPQGVAMTIQSQSAGQGVPAGAQRDPRLANVVIVSGANELETDYTRANDGQARVNDNNMAIRRGQDDYGFARDSDDFELDDHDPYTIFPASAASATTTATTFSSLANPSTGAGKSPWNLFLKGGKIPLTVTTRQVPTHRWTLRPSLSVQSPAFSPLPITVYSHTGVNAGAFPLVMDLDVPPGWPMPAMPRFFISVTHHHPLEVYLPLQSTGFLLGALAWAPAAFVEPRCPPVVCAPAGLVQSAEPQCTLTVGSEVSVMDPLYCVAAERPRTISRTCPATFHCGLHGTCASNGLACACRAPYSGPLCQDSYGPTQVTVTISPPEPPASPTPPEATETLHTKRQPAARAFVTAEVDTGNIDAGTDADLLLRVPRAIAITRDTIVVSWDRSRVALDDIPSERAFVIRYHPSIHSPQEQTLVLASNLPLTLSSYSLILPPSVPPSRAAVISVTINLYPETRAFSPPMETVGFFWQPQLWGPCQVRVCRESSQVRSLVCHSSRNVILPEGTVGGGGNINNGGNAAAAGTEVAVADPAFCTAVPRPPTTQVCATKNCLNGGFCDVTMDRCVCPESTAGTYCQGTPTCSNERPTLPPTDSSSSPRSSPSPSAPLLPRCANGGAVAIDPQRTACDEKCTCSGGWKDNLMSASGDLSPPTGLAPGCSVCPLQCNAYGVAAKAKAATGAISQTEPSAAMNITAGQPNPACTRCDCAEGYTGERCQCRESYLSLPFSTFPPDVFISPNMTVASNTFLRLETTMQFTAQTAVLNDLMFVVVAGGQLTGDAKGHVYVRFWRLWRGVLTVTFALVHNCAHIEPFPTQAASLGHIDTQAGALGRQTGLFISTQSTPKPPLPQPQPPTTPPQPVLDLSFTQDAAFTALSRICDLANSGALPMPSAGSTEDVLLHRPSTPKKRVTLPLSAPFLVRNQHLRQHSPFTPTATLPSDDSKQRQQQQGEQQDQDEQQDEQQEEPLSPYQFDLVPLIQLGIGANVYDAQCDEGGFEISGFACSMTSKESPFEPIIVLPDVEEPGAVEIVTIRYDYFLAVTLCAIFALVMAVVLLIFTMYDYGLLCCVHVNKKHRRLAQEKRAAKRASDDDQTASVVSMSHLTTTISRGRSHNSRNSKFRSSVGGGSSSRNAAAFSWRLAPSRQSGRSETSQVDTPRADQVSTASNRSGSASSRSRSRSRSRLRRGSGASDAPSQAAATAATAAAATTAEAVTAVVAAVNSPIVD